MSVKIFPGHRLIITPSARSVGTESTIQTTVGHSGRYITSEDESAAAAAPLVAATGDRRDAIAVMTALCCYGAVNFSSACEVLFRDFSEIYAEWTKLAKIACVISVSSVQNRIRTAPPSCLGENKVRRLMQTASCRETLHTSLLHYIFQKDIVD